MPHDKGPGEGALEMSGADTTSFSHPADETASFQVAPELTAARERMNAASDVQTDLNRRSIEATEEYLTALREYNRLFTLALPLRTALLDRFDPAIQMRRPCSVKKAAGWVYRDETEVRTELDALAAEGLIRKVGSGFVSVNPRSLGGDDR